MPIYTYRCPRCPHEQEELLRFAERDDPVGSRCPRCRRGRLERGVDLPARRADDAAKGSSYRMQEYVDDRLSGRREGPYSRQLREEFGIRPASDRLGDSPA